MRGAVTTVLDLGGLVAIVAGVFVLLGLGAALVAGGAAGLAVSWRVAR